MGVIIAKYSGETNYGKEVNVIVPHYAEEKFHVHTILADDVSEVITGLDVDANAKTANSTETKKV
ncbi:hypothetical protein A1O3_09295 [Capronia epimyces CBS 606.96]|uniref:Uncharacterized protein n=1 Tax=Capronia epimyces CBS 606.96 TaxID=1182542 RepID=W9Y6T5_9EURO|nr:uncharacterized protein A1O3_09295 [Capronia epimyces CBS 606.96]EXJ78134.1 hypothetical protein A1O3_09295 [Capronia epimyces CBS 606.96]